MEYKDYYQILGVAKTATPEEVKKQYRILARKYHPDVSEEKDAEEKFKQVKEAYDVLKNPEKRQAYDRLGQHWRSGAEFTPPPEWEFDTSRYADEGDVKDFSEFFANLFGGGGRARHTADINAPGRDIHSKISLFLEEAYAGTERVIQLQEPELDPATGRTKHVTRSLKVKIPPGVITGQQIRLAQQGGKGIGQGRKGDLYLEIAIAPHPRYKLKNRDVYLELPVTPWEAALGARIVAPSLGGNVEVSIPAGSQAGKKLRLKGRGLPGNPAGDQYLSLVIYIPEPRNDAERELYRTMANTMNFNPRDSLFSGTPHAD